VKATKNPKKTIIALPIRDCRQQLYNDGRCGSIKHIQVSRELIHTLRGVLFDIDPGHLRSGELLGKIRTDPVRFFERTIKPRLARHPTLAKARVVNSGTGLHVLLMFDEPVPIDSDSDRERIEAIYEAVLPVLPIDPDQPGITATTRRIGSVNTKNGAKVALLARGEPVTFEEVERLAQLVVNAPFRTITSVLLGADVVTPCPFCRGDKTSLRIMDHVGMCYGACGKVTLDQLFDRLYLPRPGKSTKEGRDA
jgi:hypothetical protein